MPREGAGPDFIEALARGLEVIAAFRPGRPAPTLAEVAAATGLARPTARRILRRASRRRTRCRMSTGPRRLRALSTSSTTTTTTLLSPCTAATRTSTARSSRLQLPPCRLLMRMRMRR